MAHILKIQVEELIGDPYRVRISDFSEYDRLLEITNRVLKVSAPGRDSTIVNLPINDSFVYTMKSFRLSKYLDVLPDGLYEFTYSICPNEKVFTKVYHFRTTLLKNNLDAFLSKFLCGSYTDAQFAKVQQIATGAILKIKALNANADGNYNIDAAYKLYDDVEKDVERLNKIDLND